MAHSKHHSNSKENTAQLNNPQVSLFCCCQDKSHSKKQSISCPISPWKTHHHKDDRATAELCNLNWKNVYII